MSTAHSNGNGRGIPAVAYYRMSSDKQTASIPEQRNAVQRYAEEHGYSILHEYRDDGVSGDATEKRHGFQRMIADAERGTFKAVLVWDMDRFGRFDSLEAGRWIYPLRQNGVALVTTDGGVIDWSDFAGRVMYGIKQEGKHQFLRDLSRNMLRGRIAAAKRGEWLSPRPLGYRVEAKRLVLGDPMDVATVKQIFAEYLGGHSLRAIAVKLTAEGHKTQRGCDWDGGSVKTILTNVAYIGTFRWGDKQTGKYNQHEDDAVVIPNNHAAIIDTVTFNAVQRRLTERRKSTTPHQDGGGFAFTGVVRCGKCGGPMYGALNTGTIRYRCHGNTERGKCDLNATGQAELLDHVLRAIEERFNEPTTVERLRGIMSKKLKQRTKTTSVVDLRKRLSSVDSKLSRARRNMALADGDDLRREYETVVRELRSERERLDGAVQDAQKPRGRSAAELDQRIDRAVKTLTRLRSAVLASPVPKQRELLAMCIAKIEVWSTRTGGKGSTYHLEHGVVHLRPDMWLTDAEADKLSSSTRNTP